MEEVLERQRKSVLTPTLRFLEFDDNWQTKKIGHLCDCIVPGRNKPTDLAGNIPWITTPDIVHNGEITYSKLGLGVSREEAKRVGSKIVPRGAIIMSCVGELGLVAIAATDIVINQQLHAFLPKPVIHNLFLLYSLSTKKKYMDRVATKTAVPYMNKDNCNSIPIAFPPLPEQQKIASFLSAVDEKIQLLKRKKELLEQYKKGVMQQLFFGKLRFKDEHGEDYPDWEEKKLGEVCEIKGRIGYRGYTVQDIVKEGKGAISISPSNMNAGKLSWTNSTFISWNKYEESPEIKVELNDTLLVKTASVGKSAFVDTLPFSATINPQLVILKRTILDPRFLSYLIYHTSIQKQIKGAVGAGAVPNLSQSSISMFKILVPHKEEQEKISRFLHSIDQKINLVTEKLDQTKTFKKGLLQQMFV